MASEDGTDSGSDSTDPGATPPAGLTDAEINAAIEKDTGYFGDKETGGSSAAPTAKHVAIDPGGVGVEGFDWSSIGEKVVDTAGKVGIAALNAGKPAAPGTAANPAPTGSPLRPPQTSVGSPPAQSAGQQLANRPLAKSNTPLIVGGIVAATAAVAVIALLASRSSSRRRSSFPPGSLGRRD